MKTVADLMVEILKEAGVEVLFGIPSIHNIGFYEALRKTPAIKHILCRHESTATHMADGYARESGRIGVVISSTGPGAGYTVPALQEALGSSVPLLVIATNISSGKIGKGVGDLHEIMGQEEIFRNITKGVFPVRTISDVEGMTRRALETALTGRPGPVYLEIPTDLFTVETETQTRPGENIELKPEVLPDLEKAVTLLREAQNPLILVGTAALRAELSQEVVTLAETLTAPVLFTANARGMIPDDHPLALGNCARRGVIRETVVSSDLVLAIGTRLREVDAKRRGLVLPRLIHVDWDDQWIGKNFPAEIALTGNLVQIVQGAGKENRFLAGERKTQGPPERDCFKSTGRDLPDRETTLRAWHTWRPSGLSCPGKAPWWWTTPCWGTGPNISIPPTSPEDGWAPKAPQSSVLLLRPPWAPKSPPLKNRLRQSSVMAVSCTAPRSFPPA